MQTIFILSLHLTLLLLYHAHILWEVRLLIHGRITLVLYIFCLLGWLLCCNAMILHVLVTVCRLHNCELVHLQDYVATSFDKPLCIEPEIDSLTVFWFSGVSPML